MDCIVFPLIIYYLIIIFFFKLKVAVKVHIETLPERSYTGDGDLEFEIQFDDVVKSVRKSYSFKSLRGEEILTSEIKVSASDVSLNPNSL
jgi:hypothetical protein